MILHPFLTPTARRFAGDRSGVAAVEFALLLPLLLVLIFGGIDVTESVSARRKAVQASSTISDLIAQAKDAVDLDDLNAAYAAGAAIMTPFDASRLETVVSSVRVDENKKAWITWSQGHNASPLPKGAQYKLPDKLLIPGSNLIMAEVVYRYKPVIGTSFVDAIDIPKTTYAQPRTMRSGIPCDWSGCT